MSDEEPKLIAIDEEANHQIVPRRRFGTAHGATHETLDPGAQIDVLAFDFLCVLFADFVWLWVEMPLLGAPSIGVEVGDANGSSNACRCSKTASCRRPKT